MKANMYIHICYFNIIKKKQLNNCFTYSYLHVSYSVEHDCCQNRKNILDFLNILYTNVGDIQFIPLISDS
jgi:hypothetical protein